MVARIAGGVLAALVALALAGGCVLFTGSTDGYSLVEGGAGSQKCSSAADCRGGGVCCVSASQSSVTSVAGVCQPSCTISVPQLCKTNAECGDAGACTSQTCNDAGGVGIPVTLQACGVIIGCQ
jgi:hypothetical protein